MVNGVAQVSVYGDQTYSPRVQVNPDKLASLGIGIDEVATAFSNETVLQPTGSSTGTKNSLPSRPQGQLTSASAYKPPDHRLPQRQARRLRDVARPSIRPSTTKTPAFSTRNKASSSRVKRGAGTNTIQLVQPSAHAAEHQGHAAADGQARSPLRPVRIHQGSHQ
jgi:HAE1 family hydrophobic/amphiphilic exporter-1